MKPICTLGLILCLLFTCCGTTLAVTSEVRSSPTMISYSATLNKGAKGKVRIHYSVTGKTTMSSIGVSSIKLYTSSGTCVATITGSTSNKLMAQNLPFYENSYTCSAVSGTSYYAIVTVVATGGGLSDSKQIKTNTVKAP